MLPILRSLFRSRRFGAAVLLMLAPGIAVLTATFGVVDGALFRQPPFPEAERVALLFLERNPEGEAQRRERWSFARFELLRRSQQSFSEVASYSPTDFTVAGSGDAEPVHGERVSAPYFSLLGGNTERGRLFSEAEDDPARPASVVVISHALWTRRWAADPDVLGRTLRLNGVPLTIIGVLAEGFAGLSGNADLWVPRTLTPQLTYAEYLTTNQNFISAVGRLRPGVSLDAARRELAVLGASINRALPSDPDAPDERVSATAVTLNEARLDDRTRRSLWILLGAVALLHLLACANATNLLLGRAASLQHESAVRVALGSSRGRLFRYLMLEGLVPGLASGALGIALAASATAYIRPPTNVWAPRNFYGSLASFDAPAFGLAEIGFGIALALVTSVLVAIPPALGAFRIEVLAGIRAGARGIMSGAMSLRRPSLRGIIVGIEAALAMLLVVAAGLLIDSFQRMRQTSIGVDPAHVLTFWMIPSEARVPPDAAPVFVSRVLDAVARVPGVVSASVDGGAPLAGTARSVLFIEGRPVAREADAPPVLRHYIAPDHFSTLGIPLLRGRTFTVRDAADAPRVTVISESAARRFWPGEDPLGRRVWFGSGSNFNSPETSAEIVGIVGDVVYAPLDQQQNAASFYTPYTQFTYASRMVFVRTAGDPMSVARGVSKAVATVDPELALRELQPLTEIVSGSRARHRFDVLLFGSLGIIALLLAATGIFAVLSYAVATRTREFGVRLALGASPRRMLWQMLREGMVFPTAGLVIGAAASLAATRLLQASLYGVSAQDPRVFASTAIVLILVACAACLVPAWRATRADPMAALRAS